MFFFALKSLCLRKINKPISKYYSFASYLRNTFFYKLSVSSASNTFWKLSLFSLFLLLFLGSTSNKKCKSFFSFSILQMLNAKSSFSSKASFLFLRLLLVKYTLRNHGKIGKQYYNETSWTKNRLRTSSTYEECQK